MPTLETPTPPETLEAIAADCDRQASHGGTVARIFISLAARIRAVAATRKEPGKVLTEDEGAAVGTLRAVINMNFKPSDIRLRVFEQWLGIINRLSSPQPVPPAGKPMTNRELLATLPVGSVVRRRCWDGDMAVEKTEAGWRPPYTLSESHSPDDFSDDPTYGIEVLSRPDASPEPVRPTLEERLSERPQDVNAILTAAKVGDRLTRQLWDKTDYIEKVGDGKFRWASGNGSDEFGDPSHNRFPVEENLFFLHLSPKPVAEVREEKPVTLRAVLQEATALLTRWDEGEQMAADYPDVLHRLRTALDMPSTPPAPIAAEMPLAKTLRDEFAMAAMIGFMAGDLNIIKVNGKPPGEISSEMIAEWSYHRADLMLAARQS